MSASSIAQEFDYLIVGAGTAGCVLAARLSEDADISVGLIEAGGKADHPLIAEPSQWPLLQGSAVDWAFRTQPQRGTNGRAHEWPRGRVLGGSTAINAMAHVRGHRLDFEGWREAGCAGWGYADLIPYFIKSESHERGASAYHGGDGPIHLIVPRRPNPVTLAYMAAGEEIGLAASPDHNGAQLNGPCLNTLTIKNGKRQTIYDAYVAPIEPRANLRVMTESHVLSLTFDRSRCRGIKIAGPQEIHELRARRAVVLCAGAIGSPVLLLRSGIGPAEELRGAGIEPRLDLPGVGRNLHDHLLSGGNIYRSRQKVPPSHYQNSESLMYVAKDRSAQSVPEMVLACVLAPVATEMFRAPAFGEAFTLMFGFTHPKSRGTIRLANDDPKQMPIIDPNYLGERYDRDIYLDALELAREVGGAKSLNDWRAQEALPGPEITSKSAKRAFLENAAFTHHHPVGTCRMGADGWAVTAPDLSVQGTEGLYVCDASIIPSITTGPVNAAIVAIAERASDLLRGRPALAPYDPALA